MRKIIILGLIISSFCASTAIAQKRNREKVKSMRIAYITNSLELSAEEAEQFWPVYNEYNTAVRSLKKDAGLKKPEKDISDEQAAEFLEKILALEQKELDLKKEYFTKLTSYLPRAKIVLLQFIEGDFRREVLSEFRNRYNRKDKKG